MVDIVRGPVMLAAPRGTDLHQIQFTATASGPGPDPNDPKSFRVYPLFEEIEEVLKLEGPDIVKKINGIYAFKVKDSDTGFEGLWILDLKNGNGEVTFNGPKKPDVTISMADDDLADLFAGTLNPQKAFFQGKMKIQGNIGLALKLRQFQQRAVERYSDMKAKL